jgi:hypothetical protein
MLNFSELGRTSLIALLAMMMVAFAPTVSRLVAAEPIAPKMVELCTAQGTKWFSESEIGGADAAEHNEAPTALHHDGNDCPYCSFSSAKFLVAASASSSATEKFEPLPSLFYQAPKPLFAWAHARSRAPPSAS